jgi:hypothetical protein
MKKKNNSEGEFEPIEIKYLPMDTANFLYKKLSKELQKANEDLLFNNNLAAHGIYIARVVGLMDDLVGLVRLEKVYNKKKIKKHKNVKK